MDLYLMLWTTTGTRIATTHHSLDIAIASIANLNSSFPSLSFDCTPLKASPCLTFRTTGSYPHEINKAVIQARFLSGKYRFERFQRHYSDTIEEGEEFKYVPRYKL